MIVTKRALPRRTVLRGFGAMLSLPLLDSMIPALTAQAKTAARQKARLGIVYVPHGAVMANWTPRGEGADFTLSPVLETLAPFRQQLVVVTGLDHKPAAQLPGEPAGGHGRIGGAWLTGVHAKPTEGADFEAGVSLDQIAAAHVSAETELRSLEVGLGATEFAGACDAGFSCAYTSTLCWRTARTPLPMESSPRAVFERLFGDGDSTDPAVRRARRQQEKSLLDAVTEKIAELQRALGPRDRAKLGEYLDAVRDVEGRIQKAEAQGARDLPIVEQPSGSAPQVFEDYVTLMFDLQLLAYQADMTRVITFMLTPELSARTYPEIGVPEPHHGLSHHQNNPDNLAKLTKVNAFHLRLFASYLEKLAAARDGDGSILDSLVLVYGSGMSDSNVHDIHNLPILLLGAGAGRLAGGRHLTCAPGTPLTNLYMTVLNKLNVPAERFGDSTGVIRELTSV
jgi:hypothetical protein